MDNLIASAYPLVDSYETGGACTSSTGFTKLEMASLMIAQGYIAAGAFKTDEQEGYEIAKCSVHMAKLILEEANK